MNIYFNIKVKALALKEEICTIRKETDSSHFFLFFLNQVFISIRLRLTVKMSCPECEYKVHPKFERSDYVFHVAIPGKTISMVNGVTFHTVSETLYSVNAMAWGGGSVDRNIGHLTVHMAFSVLGMSGWGMVWGERLPFCRCLW